MKTTVELPDDLYRKVKSEAALQGKTVKSFFLEAVQSKLAQASSSVPVVQLDREKQDEPGWRAVFGAADPEAIAEVQSIIDEEFSTIDYAAWGLPDPDRPDA